MKMPPLVRGHSEAISSASCLPSFSLGRPSSVSLPFYFFKINFDAIGLPTAPINFRKIGEVILPKIYLTLIVTNPFFGFSQNCA
jgi:hypothetical protein